jgi:hypothetical protein
MPLLTGLGWFGDGETINMSALAGFALRLGVEVVVRRRTDSITSP